MKEQHEPIHDLIRVEEENEDLWRALVQQRVTITILGTACVTLFIILIALLVRIALY